MSDPTIEAMSADPSPSILRQALERLEEIERRLTRIEALIEKMAVASGIAAHG